MVAAAYQAATKSSTDYIGANTRTGRITEIAGALWHAHAFVSYSCSDFMAGLFCDTFAAPRRFVLCVK